jgi:hypothetical protein
LGGIAASEQDDQDLRATSEALIYAAMSHRMVRRLARGGQAAWEHRRRQRQLPLPLARL